VLHPAVAILTLRFRPLSVRKQIHHKGTEKHSNKQFSGQAVKPMVG
jgi:hypothetical protein